MTRPSLELVTAHKRVLPQRVHVGTDIVLQPGNEMIGRPDVEGCCLEVKVPGGREAHGRFQQRVMAGFA